MTDRNDRTALAQQLVATWEVQQEVYIPHREARFDLMLDLVEWFGRADGERLRVLDVACGPGSAAQRVLRRFPDAQVVAVDKDPLLLTLGRLNQAAERQPTWLEADLRDASWTAELPIAEFDAVVSTTALHWLTPSELSDLYTRLHGLLRPGGVLLNGDYLPGRRPRGRIDEALKAIGEARGEALVAGGSPDWKTWWDEVRAAPEFAAEVAAHDEAFRDRLTHDSASLAFHREALREAGFGEVALVWQDLAEGLVVALA